MLTVGGGVRSIIVGAEPPGYGAPHGEAFLPRPFNARALHELIDRILGA
jgi:hypothetical protein